MGKSIESERGLVGEGSGKGVTGNEYGVCFWNDKNTLESDSSNGCIALCVS